MMRRYEIPLAAAAMAIALSAMACRGGESPPQDGQTAPGTERTPKAGAFDTAARPVPMITMRQPGGVNKPGVR